MPEIPNFSEILTQWYQDNKRDLPWRKTKDPYIIWVSEIILQQTRVEQGTPYFERFIHAFPTVKTLGNAKEQDVLKLWQGLGYYSRARNMHKAAKKIISEHNGEFPGDYESIIKLNGIGSYTAAAITSFAYNMPFPVIDGNVIRVISRIFGIDEVISSSGAKKRIELKTKEVFNYKNPGTFNQALMEYGALLCKPSNPDCKICPFASYCIAFTTGKIDEIPLKKVSSNKKNRFFNYAVIRNNDKLILKKRNQKDIWQNLYDFPMIENGSLDEQFQLENIAGIVSEEKVQYKSVKISDWKSQILSHQKIHARFHEFDLDAVNLELLDEWQLTEIDKIDEYPVPKMIESYINGM